MNENNKEQLDFLKQYYNILKEKSNNNIMDRFDKQVKSLYSIGEIDGETAKFVMSMVAAAKEFHKISTTKTQEEDLKIAFEWFKIGLKMAAENDGKIVAEKLKRVSNNETYDISNNGCMPSSSSSNRVRC
jgi:hypothetical protein